VEQHRIHRTQAEVVESAIDEIADGNLPFPEVNGEKGPQTESSGKSQGVDP